MNKIYTVYVKKYNYRDLSETLFSIITSDVHACSKNVIVFIKSSKQDFAIVKNEFSFLNTFVELVFWDHSVLNCKNVINLEIGDRLIHDFSEINNFTINTVSFGSYVFYKNRRKNFLKYSYETKKFHFSHILKTIKILKNFHQIIKITVKGI